MKYIAIFGLLLLFFIGGCKRNKTTSAGGTGDLLLLHNYERESRGLSRLKIDPVLEERAQLWAEHMAESNDLTHSRLNINSTDYIIIGENIAMGYQDEKSVMNGWMNSTGHKKNILNPKFTHIGFGSSKQSNGTIYWCVQFAGEK